MPNLTINLDDETHRLAKIYVATHGTSLSRIFREHIRNLVGQQGAGEAGLTGEAAVLERYSKSEISAQEAMDALDIACLEELYGRVCSRGLALPRMDEKSARTLVKPLLALLRAPVERGARNRA